jgi:hypothetical protein
MVVPALGCLLCIVGSNDYFFSHTCPSVQAGITQISQKEKALLSVALF